jgi:hypothetical protein
VSNEDELKRMKNQYLDLRAKVLYGLSERAAAEAGSIELARTMKEFCSANGYDLRVLGEFLEKADIEAVSYFSPG